MNIQLADFEGPFDLLLHLVRVSKMDIYEINIIDIIDQYLEFIEKNKTDIDTNSEEETEFNIKSEEDLKNKLIEYEKYKNMTETFKELSDKRADYYTKLPENLNDYVEDQKIINTDISVEELLKAFLEMQKRVNFNKPITTKIAKKEYSIKERTIEIRKLLKEKKILEFTELFDILTKENIVVTFLSILDMSRNREINLKQDKLFSTIVIERVEE